MAPPVRMIGETKVIVAMALSLLVNPGWFSVFGLDKSGAAYSATLMLYSACVGLALGSMWKWWGQWGSGRRVVFALFVASVGVALLAPALMGMR